MSKNDRNQARDLFHLANHSHEHGRPAFHGLIAHGPAKKSNRPRARRPGLPSDILTRTSLLF